MAARHSFRRPYPRLGSDSREQLSRVREVYERNSDAYIERSPKVVAAGLKDWLDAAVLNLPTDASILEVGTGPGRDAQYLEAQGYQVQRSDVAAPFVEALRNQGHRVLNLDAVADPIPGPFDLLFANAVVCHFSKEQLQIFLTKCSYSAAPGGRIALTTKMSRGGYHAVRRSLEGDKRPFFVWPPRELSTFVESCGFEVSYSRESEAIFSSNPWINLVAVKNPSNGHMLF